MPLVRRERERIWFFSLRNSFSIQAYGIFFNFVYNCGEKNEEEDDENTLSKKKEEEIKNLGVSKKKEEDGDDDVT